MNKGQIYGLLAAIVVCGCSEKKDTVDPLPVKVKMMQVVTELSQTGQSYAGTIEEMNGTALSFSGIGTIKQLFVHEGQMVRAGQLIGELDATSATNAHAMALATKEQAEDALERMTMLHDAGALPEVKWVEVQTQVRQARAQEQIARKDLPTLGL